jgi:predicted dehydrogenase
MGTGRKATANHAFQATPGAGVEFLSRSTMTSIAFVGCAHIHTPGFVKRVNENPATHCALVWDHDAARAAIRAAELGAQTTAALDAIWHNDDIAAVVVCSETDRHAELVAQAVAAGKHLFVEKPLGLGARDAWAMAHAIEDAGLIFQTGYFMRSAPHSRFIQQLLHNGTLGRITRIRHSNCHAGSLKGWFDTEWRWMADPAIAGCGGFGDLGTHSLDLLMWWMGDVAEVSAQIQSVTDRYDDCDETGEALLLFDNQAIGTLAAGWVDQANSAQCMISGTEGYVHITDGTLHVLSANLEGADGGPWTELPEGLPHAFDLFLAAINGDTSVALVTPAEAAARSAVMEAIYRSNRERCRVRPERF